MRKLASVQKVLSVSPIDNAQNIEKITVLGWELVAKKGEFKPGDMVVYVEVDSILPDRPEFEFMRERKFRVRTIKLRGQVSQGICFPLSILPPSGNLLKEGADVTDMVGVKKYDPQADAEKIVTERRQLIHNKRMDKFFMRYKWYRHFTIQPKRLPFPAWIKKTDEDRIQLFPNICQDYADVVFRATEKVDGQSATYFIIRNRKRMFWQSRYSFGVCSRNFQLLRKDDSSYWQVAEKYDIKRRMIGYAKEHPQINELVVQGEILGPKIQGNKYGLSELRFKIFNSFTNGVYFDTSPVFLPSEHVEWIGWWTLPETIPQAVELAKGTSLLADIPREGVVLRLPDGSFSFKIINPDFLLKYSD